MIKHPGAPALLEVGTAQVDLLEPLPRPDSRERLIQAIASFLNQVISYEEARNVFLMHAGRTEPIDRLNDILECDDVPLAVPDDGEDAKSRKTRPWTVQEDNRLLAAIYKYGLENWSTVSQFVGSGRSRAQSAQRWNRGINPRISKENWTPEEETKLLQLVQQFGDRAWTRIAQLIGSRSDVQCRYHYNQIIKAAPQAPPQRIQPPYNAASLPNQPPGYMRPRFANINFNQPGYSGMSLPPQFTPGSPPPVFKPIMPRPIPPTIHSPPNYYPGSPNFVGIGSGEASPIAPQNYSEKIASEPRRMSAIVLPPETGNQERPKPHFAGPEQIQQDIISHSISAPGSIDGFLRQFQTSS